MLNIEVVAAVGLRDVAVCIRQVPLSTCGACIVARRGLGIEAELRHQTRAHVVVVEVAADAQLGYLYLIRAEYLARPVDGVVLRVTEVVGVVDVGADLRREELSRIGCVLGAGVAVEPGEVGKGEGHGLWIGRVDYLRLFLGKSGWRR